MANFFKVGGKWITPKQMREHRDERLKLLEVFCPWCVSKAARHTKICPTRKEDFDPENTPKLTSEEREILINKK